jgi:hypothetical protein
MSYSQTTTQSKSGYQAGVKDYKLTYYTPDYTPKDTDILAAFRMTPQPGVPPGRMCSCGGRRILNRYLDHGVDRPVDRYGSLQGPLL